ncbi:MAG: hypothetical protein AAF799_28995 [Myxococcota bacterium]
MVDTPEDTQDENQTEGTELMQRTAGLSRRADAAHVVPSRVVAQRVEALSADELAKESDDTLLRAGTALVDGGHDELAARCFAALENREAVAGLARLGLAWASWARGEAEACADGLKAAAELDAAVALVAEGTELRAVRARAGGIVVLATSTDDGEHDVERLGRGVSEAEASALTEQVKKLESITVPAAAGYRAVETEGHAVAVTRDASPGKPLSQSLADAPQSLEDALAIVEPLGKGLAAAHEQGVCHGAVGPDLVSMAPAGPVLRGFGLGGLVGPSPADVARGYVAPERLAGEATPGSDTYSLAALLYRLVTGRDAVGALVRPSTMQLDPRLDELFAEAMHPDASERPDVAAVAARAQKIASTPGEAQPVAAAGSQPIIIPDDADDLDAWGQILDRKPTHREALDAIARIEADARSGGRWDQVAEVLGLRVKLVEVQADRIALRRELVETYEQKLSAPGSALREVQSLIEEVPVAEQVTLVAELQRLAEVTGQWGPLADSMEIVAERAPQPADQARLYAALGQAYAEHLGASDRALVAYEKAIAIEADAATLSAVVPLHRKAGQVAELVGALLNLAEHQEGADKAQSLRDAATVLHDDLGDVEGAFATLRAALEEEPGHAEALESAETFARELEDWESLVDLLDQRAGATDDAATIVELRSEAASLAAEQLKDPAAAITQLEKILDVDPAHADSVRMQVELLRGLADGDAARRTALIAALESLAELSDRKDDQAALWAEQARHLDAEPDGKPRAATARERVVELLGFEHEVVREAAEALERWYRRDDRFDDLSALLMRAGGSKDADTSVRVDAWSKVFDLRKEGSFADEDAAIEALEALTALDSEDHRWRDQLLERYLAREQFDKAGPLIRQQVDDDSIDPKRKAALLWRGGQLREQIGKQAGALEALEEAVELDPSLYDAWLALRDLYRQQDQPLKAIVAQVSAGRAHPNRAEKVSLLFDAAKVYLETLGQPEKGLTLLEELVEFDPDHREATGMLVDHLVAEGDMVRAWPIAQTWVAQVRSQARDDKALNVRALSVAGRCALAVEQPDRAREYLEKARNADATNFDVLRLLGEIDMNAERWEDALKSYQSVVLGGADKIAPAELSQTYLLMATARMGMGERPKAVQLVERSLDIDGENRAAIDKLVELAEDAAGRVKAKQRLAELLAKRGAKLDGEEQAAVHDERIALLKEIAQIQTTELEAPEDAARTLEVIMEMGPTDPAVLHELLSAFTKAGRWRDVTRVLDLLVDAQDADSMRAKYLYAGAAIFRDQLADSDGFVAWARRVLEADPMHVKAFRGIADQLEKKGAWKELAKHLRGRLKSLPKDAPKKDRVELFARLGEVYEEKLGDAKTALAAFSQAVRFGSDKDPQARQRRVKIMDLAISLGSDEVDKAISQAHALINDDPMEFSVYHRLVELYEKRGNRTRATSVARTLAFLKQANEAEQALADAVAEKEPQIRSVVNREQWRKNLYHPLQDPRITEIFSIVWPMVAAREGHTHAHHSIERDQRAKLSMKSQDPLARYLAYAAQIYEVPAPDYFARRKEPGGLRIDALCDGEGDRRRVFPTVLAGRDTLIDQSEVGLKFRAAGAISRVRPGHVLASVLPSIVSLRHVFYGAAVLAGMEAPPDSNAEAERLAKHLGKFMTPAQVDQLGTLARKVLDKGEPDLKGWVQGVAYTAGRAGFVLCDSIDASARVLTQQGDEGMAVPFKDRIRDLVGYSVSIPYLKLRKDLGLNR